MSLAEAAALVSDGEHVALGGCTMSRTPLAMIWALIRARKKDLMISRSIVSSEGDLLFASGVSRHILTSWFSQGIVWGVSKVMRHYTESKQARFEEWSHMSIGLRYRAGAMGVPFMPSRTMMGPMSPPSCRRSKRSSVRTPASPWFCCRPLNPDVALIHVQPLRRLRERPNRRFAIHGPGHRDGRQAGHPDHRTDRLQRSDSPRP